MPLTKAAGHCWNVALLLLRFSSPLILGCPALLPVLAGLCDVVQHQLPALCQRIPTPMLNQCRGQGRGWQSNQVGGGAE